MDSEVKAFIRFLLHRKYQLVGSILLVLVFPWDSLTIRKTCEVNFFFVCFLFFYDSLTNIIDN